MHYCKLIDLSSIAWLISSILEKMPFGMVNLLINKVVEQCNEQLQEIPQMEGTMEELKNL